MFADKIYILISGLIIGIILYQSSIVAITVFKNLDEKNTSVFLRKIFPQFFKTIIFLNAYRPNRRRGGCTGTGWPSS